MTDTFMQIMYTDGSRDRGWLLSIVKRGIVVRNIMASTLQVAMNHVGEYKRIHRQETVTVAFWDQREGVSMPIETDADLVMIALSVSR